MIARDEARCIGRALESLRPWVDRMIVLDTGSSDATPRLAAEAGAQVHHLPWPDDFAAARNAALALNSCDWAVVVDADEWLAAGGETLAALRTQAPDFVGQIEIASSYDNHGQAASSSTWLPRVLPNVAPNAVRYEGRIHEHPRHSLPLRRLPLRLAHDGYEPVAMRNKGDRNLRLLQAALRDAPGDPYLLYQLGKDHEVHDRFADATIAYEKALRLCPADRGYRHDLVIRQLFTLKQVGRTEDAIRLAQAEMANWNDSPDFWFTLGDVLLGHTATLADADALALLTTIEGCWKRCVEIGESDRYEGAVAGRGSVLARRNLELLAQLEPSHTAANSGS